MFRTNGNQPNSGMGFFSELMTNLVVFFDRWIETHSTIYRVLSGFLSPIGQGFYNTLQLLKALLKKFYQFLHRLHGQRVNRAYQRNFRKSKVVWNNLRDWFLSPFRKIRSIAFTLKTAVTETKGQAFFPRVRHFFYVCGVGIKANTHIIKGFFNYALPIAGICWLIYTIQLVSNLTFVVNVTYHGENLGYVSNQAVINEAKEIVQGRMVYLNDSERIKLEPNYSIELVNEQEVVNEYQLADAMIGLSGDEMLQAEGLYINGQFYGALSQSDVIQQTLDTILQGYYQQENVEEAHFVDDIEVISGLYLTNNILSEQDIVNLLQSEVMAESYYTIVDGDTPLRAAYKNNMAYQDLKALNPEIENSSWFRGGQQLLLNKAEPFLSVELTKTEIYTEAIPFETETIESATLEKGKEEVSREGENGENQITAKVTYIDGSEISREVMTTEVVKEPVHKQITKGTMEPVVEEETQTDKNTTKDNNNKTTSQNAASSIQSVASSSGFINPLPGCYLSSGYGTRWGATHGGSDLCVRGGTMGKPIYAAASGTVIAASNAGSYGKLVKIRHSNGIETWYAHTSSMVVSQGQTVSQGQLIAYAGATGQVTGPHLHLEVRVNGIRKNPLDYIPGIAR